MFSPEEKQFIIALARQSIEHFLETGERLLAPSPPVARATTSPRAVEDTSLPTPRLSERGACFVTLTKDFELRGCVGHLEATEPLYLDIIENAYAAAFEDARFFPVTKKEWPEIEVEVSVLTKPAPTTPAPLLGQEGRTSPSSILDKLRVGIDGVIVRRGNKTATYLPQVWDEILDKKDFLSSLCLKAGLDPADWQKPGLEIFTYQVEIVSESAF